MRLNGYLFVITFLTASVGVRVTHGADGEQFSFSLQSTTRAEGHAHGVPSQISTDPGGAKASVLGTESSVCGAGEERRSNASSSATVRRDLLEESRIGFTLEAAAYANGGHFVRCGTCQWGVCIGRFGEDTGSLAKADANAVVELRFYENARPLDYNLMIGSSVSTEGASYALRLEDQSGKVLFTSTSSGGITTIRSEPGAIFRLITTINSNAGDRGGCCSSRRTGTSTVSLAISRAPIIASTPISERIVGGEETDGYPTVGAILFGGQMHCSGTMVGRRTVLTAAHCLYRFPLKEFAFVTGSNVDAPQGVFKVTGGEYPQGEDGLAYDDSKLVDDIAVLYLDRDVSDLSPLYVGEPSLESLLNAKRRLTFVGFGYNVIAGNKIGSGIKRMVEMPLAGVEMKTFRYAVSGANTCNGDSGGPAFMASGQYLLVTGVTSGGDRLCTNFGVNTRVDTYRQWLLRRVK